MKCQHLFLYTLAISLALSTIAVTALEVKITQDIESVKVIHNGEEVTIMRNQDQNNLLNSEYTKTSRPCPTYCINPMKLAPGVETIGELEVLDYLRKIREGDNSIMVIDSRTPEWVVKGSIPGSVNIPWDVISASNNKSESAFVKKVLEEQSEDICSSPIIRKILEEQLGVRINDVSTDFENAKTLVLFCNGPWCKRSPANIMTLIELGYPPEKLKWYRGGMQSWELFGLTTVTDIPMPWLGL